MADSPLNSPTGDREYSPAVRRLAKRYGMTPEAIENIISGTGVAASPIATATESAAVTQDPSADSRDAALPRELAPVPPPPQPRAKAGPGLTIALAVVLLVALVVALSFKKGCFHQRSSDTSIKPNSSDTLLRQDSLAPKQASEPPQPSPVTPPQVPPEALVVPQETPPGTTGPASHSGATTMKQAIKESQGSSRAPGRTPLITTSSYLEAQERLAELRAAGNKRARVVAKGSAEKRTYSVYTR